MARGIVCMLDKYGTAYNAIVSQNNSGGSSEPYHPNAGEDLSEIVDVMNWFMTELPGTNREVYDLINDWVFHTLAHCIYSIDDGYYLSEEEMLEEVFLGYTREEISSGLYDSYKSAYDAIHSNNGTIKNPSDIVKILDPFLRVDTKVIAKKISDILNQYFLRVRNGGKYNYEGEDTIYFRISSKGYDWRPVIADYLYDTFYDIHYMPREIWVGHDLETNPPEVTLFDGSPEEFFDADTKIYEAYKAECSKGDKFINKERKSIYKHIKLIEAYRRNRKRYVRLV